MTRKASLSSTGLKEGHELQNLSEAWTIYSPLKSEGCRSLGQGQYTPLGHMRTNEDCERDRNASNTEDDGKLDRKIKQNKTVILLK